MTKLKLTNDREIKEFLIKELNKTKHILTWGTIGSCNIERDIDTIVTKKAKSSTSDFYKEIHSIFDKVNSYLLKKYGLRAVVFHSHEKEFLALSKFKKQELAFQILPYATYDQMERDWKSYFLPGESIKNFLKKNYKCLFGDLNDIFNKKFTSKTYYDPLYIRLSEYDRCCSRYPKKLLLTVTNHYYDFLFRKLLKIKPLVAKNEKQVREIFYKLCDIVDELNKSKN